MRNLKTDRRVAICGCLLALSGLAASLVTRLEASEPLPPQPPPCSAPEYRQFDFWVGDWLVSRPDGTPAGINRVQKILRGCVLQERWESLDGSRGESYNMYFAADGRWRQTWVDSAGGRLDLAGGLEDEAMVLSGEMPTPDGSQALHEIRWSPLKGGQVRQHWRVSHDAGETWRDVFVGIYSRRQPTVPTEDE